MQCVGAVGTACQAGMLVGGPIVYKYYRRIRAALGLPDNSYAAVQACAAAEAMGEASPPAPRPIRVNVMPRPPVRANNTASWLWPGPR